MPLLIDQDDAVVVNISDLTDAPAVRITGARVHFSNSGTLLSNSRSSAAVVLDGFDTYLFNAATGIIRCQDFPYSKDTAIIGSAGADIIVNEGTINGNVELGDGNDTFIQRNAGQVHQVRMGAGDDLFSIETKSNVTMFASGGDGWDRMVIGSSVNSLVNGADGFEQLELQSTSMSLTLVGDFQRILLAAGGSYSFTTSSNPLVDLTMDGGAITVGNRSKFRSISGSEGVEFVDLNDLSFARGGVITGGVRLGGGNDRLSITWTNSGTASEVQGFVDGGDGTDQLNLIVAGGRSYDLARMSGFENLSLGNSPTGDVRVQHADSLAKISVSGKAVLEQSNSPNAILSLFPKANVMIDGGSAVGIVTAANGSTTVAGYPSVQTADEARAVTLVNDGTIGGDVILFLGSDQFDSRGGSVSGTVYGLAGNDTILMGAGDDHVDGGYGADHVEGGAGADSLVGGGGDDVLMGEGGEDILFGGGGDDRLEGGDDFDQLDGGTGSDILYGGAGDDVFDDDDEAGGAGNDQMFGEDGWDSMSINRRGLSAPTSVLMDGGRGPDVITFSDQTAWRNSATLIGGEGDDNISAFRGSTLTIDAGAGNDRVSLNFLGATTTVTLGAGRDFLTLAAFDGAPPSGGSITVTDFETGDLGDRLELLTYLVQRLAGWDPESNPFGQQYLRLVQDGADTLLELDSDGASGSAPFSPLLRLQNVTAANLTTYNLGGYAGDGTTPALTRITGTPDLDQLWGTGGMDIIQGLGSQDEIFGGAGDDWIEGGDGKDLLYGQYGDDRLFGESGVDNLIDEEGGDDQLFGGDHTDYIVVLRRNPTALSNVLLDGGEGDDFLDFNALYRTDRATLLGGNGNDSLKLAGNGEMIAEGGAGNDHFEVNYSNGHAILTLGAGADDVMVGGEFGFGVYLQVTINDFAAGDGGDRIDLSNYLSQRTGWDGVTNPFAAGYLKLRQSGADTLLRIDLDGAEPGAATTLITLRNVDGQSLTMFNLGFAPGVVEGAAIKGSEGDDVLVGTDAGESISGFGGNDSLTGGGGDDQLIGGLGSDSMRGGLGDDVFYVDLGGDGVFENAGEGNDRVAASASFSLGAGAEIERLEAVNQSEMSALNLAGNEFAQTIIGNAGANLLDGGGSNDVLIALGGDDALLGGAGSDIMYGGLGNDVYYVQDAGDQVFETGGEGDDRVAVSVSFALAAGSEVETIETITQSDTTALNLHGNAFAQTVIGNDGVNLLDGGAGNDILVGLGGNDSLLGGSGSDAMYGGAGDDVYYVQDAGDQVFDFGGEGNDRVAASVSFALAAGSSVETIETITQSDTTALNLTGNELGNLIVGNNGANLLSGGGGNDVMKGLGGNDVLIGSFSASTFYGGTGNDTYYVFDGSDAVIEYAGEGADRIAAATSYTLLAGSEVETIEAVNSTDTTALNFTGNALAQTLVGNNGANVLNGGGGADILQGRGGDDLLYVDNDDTVIEAAGGGNDTVLVSNYFSLTAGAHVETLRTIDDSGTAAITLWGNELSQTVIGNAGANQLNGGGGADVLKGLGGADVFVFNTALGGGNVDTILDFLSVDDHFFLDRNIFTGLTAGSIDGTRFVFGGSAALDADDRIIYNTTTGELFFDSDGTGVNAAVLFTVLTGAPSINSSDFQVI